MPQKALVFEIKKRSKMKSIDAEASRIKIQMVTHDKILLYMLLGGILRYSRTVRAVPISILSQNLESENAQLESDVISKSVG